MSNISEASDYGGSAEQNEAAKGQFTLVWIYHKLQKHLYNIIMVNEWIIINLVFEIIGVNKYGPSVWNQQNSKMICKIENRR